MAYSNSWTNSTPATSLAVTVSPTAHDVLLFWAVVDLSGETPNPFTWPSGFSEIVRQNTTGDGQTLAVAIKADASGSETSLTVTSDHNKIGGVVAFSGRDNASPQDFTANVTNTNTPVSSPLSITSGSVTPGNDDCDFLAVFGEDTLGNPVTGCTFSTASGTTGAWTTRHNQTDGGFTNVSAGTANQTTAGAVTINGSATYTGTADGALAIIGLKSSGAPPAAIYAPGYYV